MITLADKTLEDSLLSATGSATVPTYVNSSGDIVACTSLSLNTTGSAAKLTTARTICTNLASTSTASFNGTANITPGVTGTLPIGYGGTGATSAANARSNLSAASRWVSLWSGSSNGTITLSSSAANYTILRIFFRDNDTRYGSIAEVYSPNGKSAVLSVGTSGNYTAIVKTRCVNISGTSISTATMSTSTFAAYWECQFVPMFTASSTTAVDGECSTLHANMIYITNVLGQNI